MDDEPTKTGIKFGDLKGIDVVSLEDASKLGSIDDVMLDLKRYQVLGFRVKMGGLFSAHEALLLSDVLRVGKDAVTISRASALNDERRFPELQGSAGSDSFSALRVMSEHGSDIGTVIDIDLEFPGGAVTGFVLRAGMLERIQGKELFIPVSAVKTIGEKLMVVADDVVPAQ